MRHVLVALLVLTLIITPTLTHADAGVSPDAAVVIVLAAVVAVALVVYGVIAAAHQTTGWTPEFCANHHGEGLYTPMCGEHAAATSETTAVSNASPAPTAPAQEGGHR